MIAQQCAEADCGRYKEHGDAKENLAEVDIACLSCSVLEVGVRHERGHGLENCAGEEHPLAIRIQRHPRLERQNHVAVNEQHGIENQQGTGILLPVLGTAVQTLFEPV